METINFGEEQNNSAPKAPNNRKKKLIWAGIILAALILSVIGWQYWQYIHSPYYQQMKAAKELEKLYADDNIGGKTPEETLQMFLDAVKKEDFDLASQYAIFDLRPEIKNKLTEYKNSEYWQAYLGWLSSAKKSFKKDYDFGPNSATYESFDNQGRRVIFVSLVKNKNYIWKINEF